MSHLQSCVARAFFFLAFACAPHAGQAAGLGYAEAQDLARLSAPNLRAQQARGERDDEPVDAEGGGDTAGFIGAWAITDNGDVPPRMIIRGPATRAGGYGGVAVNPKNGEVYGVGSNAVMTYLVPHFFKKPQ